MRRHFLKSLFALLPLGWLGVTGHETQGLIKTDPTMQDRKGNDNETFVAAFELDRLKQEQAAGQGPYLNFFDNRTTSMGLYMLPKGGKDDQSPHKFDEVYFIVEGKAILDVEGKDYPAQPGSIIFVERQKAHHFHHIEEDLRIIVFFSKELPGT